MLMPSPGLPAHACIGLELILVGVGLCVGGFVSVLAYAAGSHAVDREMGLMGTGLDLDQRIANFNVEALFLTDC